MQEELVLDAWVALVTLEQVHHFGDLDHKVGVNFALGADAEEIVLCHACVCLMMMNIDAPNTQGARNSRISVMLVCI